MSDRNQTPLGRPVDRRRFLQVSGAATVAALTGGGTLLTPPEVAAAPARGLRAVDLRIALKARRGKVAILPGPKTPVWRFTAKVSAGDPAAVQPIPGSYLGPTIRARAGQRVAVDFNNRLREESIVHWHGLHVPEDADGHPRFAVPKGGKYHYEFDVLNRAGMYWYHPHPHERTGPQVYNGLAGLFIVSDDEEDALGLPSGEYDVPVVIQDRMFANDNRLQYLGGMGGGGTMFMGMLGNQILVNGKPDVTLDVEARPYRLRLLNGSNSRIYKLAWEDGTRFTVIGTDGGLLRKPVKRNYITLAPAERVEIWVDFADRGVGAETKLISLPFMNGQIGMPGGDEFPQGMEFDILTVRVTREGTGGNSLPAKLSSFPKYKLANAKLSSFPKYKLANAVNRRDPRRFEYSFASGRWVINARTFQMTAVAADQIVQLGTLEVWELENLRGSGPGMGMGPAMPHPVHLHGQQFQVLDRKVDPRFATHWRDVKDGYVDEGWKDTVLLMPGEKVRILRRFDDYTGLFLQHCHNLEHEDMGMMRNFRIE